MSDQRDLVNTWTEPQLFPSGGLAVSLECLVDREEGTVLFVCTSRDVSAGKLLALWSSSPQDISDFDTVARRAYREYFDQVHNVTGPFPHQ
jgi:hypothetical protein